MYKIIRNYLSHPERKRTIKTGLTLEEARAHCSDHETSSSTCQLAANKKRTDRYGPWFDGYEET